MLIASIVLVCILVVFILVTYIMTLKNYTFVLEEGTLQVKNRGSKLKVYVDGVVVVSQVMPQLIHGESYLVDMKGRRYTVKCKCNSFGNKMRVEVFDGDKLIQDNGVELPQTKKKQEK